MKVPKISVIVPIYRVEPYLSKCLGSIVSQTYQNLEIILVDDGSPDNCGAICDEYAAQDGRVKVIHKANGGVASARNVGLATATGDWIGWVDSDDRIEPDMFEYLLSYALEQNADIAVCGRYEEYDDHLQFRGWEQAEVLNKEEALGNLLKNDVMQNFLWDKLWKRRLFEGIVFPEGKTYEDIAVMHRLFEQADRVVCLPEAKYYYFQRLGSIVTNQSLENRVNQYCAAKVRLDEMYQGWPQFRQLLEAQCIGSAIEIWKGYYSSSKEDRRKYQSQLREISNFSKQHYRKALKYMNLGITGCAVLHLIPHATWWSFILAGWCGWAYEWKHGRRRQITKLPV